MAAARIPGRARFSAARTAGTVGGGVTLWQGFWHGGAAAGYRIYLPLVLRNDAP